MERLIKWLKWFDKNLIKLLLIGFIFLIPIYPKFPLQVVNYTYVAIRLEDFYITFMVLVFLIQVLRKKVGLRKDFLLIFSLFWIAVFISFLYGVFIKETILYRQVGFFHALRRVEYMIVFFIAASLITSPKELYYYLRLIMISLLFVSLYGIGQKFLGFPAIQTMNDEFAKGRILYLTPEARISSTFAGHYDLAAYIVLLMPLVLALRFYKKTLLYFFLFIISLFTLTLTASRVSYIAYILSVMHFIIFIKKTRLLIVVIIFTVGFTLFSKNLTSRFVKTLQIKQIFINEKTGQVIVPQKITTKELPAGTFYIPVKEKEPLKATADGNIILKEKIREEVRTKASKTGKTLSTIEEERLIATISARLKAITTIVSDISFATRLQVEWPRAIKAFIRSPLLGTGPSSITEATDNDYLRWLGEFGLIGTSLFLIIIFLIIKKILVSIHQLDKEEKIVYFGFLFGLLAMFINAGYIDVFEASKVAYTFWVTAGFFIGRLSLFKIKQVLQKGIIFGNQILLLFFLFF